MESEFRRKAPRRDFGGRVGLLYKGKMTISFCTQLGEGGALVTLQQDLVGLQKEDELVITLFLPNIGGVVAYAQCVYLTDNQKAGLQFVELDMKYKVKIREFVSRRKRIEAL